MFKGKQAIALGRIYGIPIEVDFSWFLIFALVTWSLAIHYFPTEFKGRSIEYWTISAITSMLLFASVLLHELGHSLIARHYRIPVRNITLFVFGGISQIAGEPPGAATEFAIAIAGPLVSFVLALIFKALQLLFVGIPPLLAVTTYLTLINGSLAVFNLIPGFPLDGGRVYRALLWAITHNFRRSTQAAAQVGRTFAFLFIVFGLWRVFAGDFWSGIWIIFIGWFLDNAALSQLRHFEIRDMLTGHKVANFISQDFPKIPAETPIQQLVSENILGSGQRYFMVEQGYHIVGLLTLHQINAIDKLNWSSTLVCQAMLPMEKLKLVDPETELWTALDQMDRDGVNQLPVMSEGHLVGLLTRESIIGYLRTLKELGV